LKPATIDVDAQSTNRSSRHLQQALDTFGADPHYVLRNTTRASTTLTPDLTAAPSAD
jgi:hypothetical protein